MTLMILLVFFLFAAPIVVSAIVNIRGMKKSREEWHRSLCVDREEFDERRLAKARVERMEEFDERRLAKARVERMVGANSATKQDESAVCGEFAKQGEVPS